MRILLIEDERTLAGFIEQSLDADGYAVTVCNDGESGAAAALTGDYALVLLDLTLPGKDGLEVLGAIRERMPELPVIVLTARAAIEQRVDGLDRGANDYVTKPFAFEELLARVRAHLRSPGQAQSSVLELTGFFEDLRRDLPLFGERAFRLEAVSGTIEADPDRLTQVLRNLVRNAVTHTKPGDQVNVAAHARDGQLEITVSDTGPGIPPDQLERIFERFHRVDGGRSRDTGGSGLGLAIARAIVEAHGGSIYAESSRDAGATFHIELPGYRAAAHP